MVSNPITTETLCRDATWRFLLQHTSPSHGSICIPPEWYSALSIIGVPCPSMGLQLERGFDKSTCKLPCNRYTSGSVVQSNHIWRGRCHICWCGPTQIFGSSSLSLEILPDLVVVRFQTIMHSEQSSPNHNPFEARFKVVHFNKCAPIPFLQFCHT